MNTNHIRDKKALRKYQVKQLKYQRLLIKLANKADQKQEAFPSFT